MKIIARAEGEKYLVEMTVGEIAEAAGFSSHYSNEWDKAVGKRYPDVGTVINVNAAYNYHERVRAHQREAGSAANTLRALADLIGGALPDVVIPPVDPDFAEVSE